MAKRPSGSRRRSQSVDQEDAFVARIVEVSTWSKKNSQVLILFGVALVVVVAGIWYYVNYRGELQAAAAQELEVIQQQAQFGDPEGARLRLSQFLERFGGTPYAPEARMTLASLHLEAGNPNEALEVLRASNVSLGDPLGPQLAVLQARALEDAGEFAEAEALYLQVADEALLDFQQVEALQDAARMRMAQDAAAGAVELYERILDEMELADDRRGAIELRLAEARTRTQR